MADGSMPEIRLSDSERDEVIAQLSQATSEGRLELAEFEQRSKLVYAAKVRSDLDGVLDGLPVEAVEAVGRSAASARPAPGTRSKRWFLSLLGDHTYRGSLDMGSKSIAISLIGDTTFDLTDIDDRHIDLSVFSLMGDITLIIAPGTRVDAGGLVVMGDRRDDTLPPGRPRPTIDPQTVRFRAWGLMGDVKVRHAS